MAVYYKNNQGFNKPYQLVQADGITPFDLTGASVTWYFKDTNAGTITSILGTVTNASLGMVNFVVPANFFGTVTVYQCQLVITLGTDNISTDPPFYVTILLGANLSS